MEGMLRLELLKTERIKNKSEIHTLVEVAQVRLGQVRLGYKVQFMLQKFDLGQISTKLNVRDFTLKKFLSFEFWQET